MSSALALATSPRDHVPTDRRREPRSQISIAVKQEVDDEVFLCQAGNINTGGMFLVRAADDRPARSTRSWLSFTLPESDTLLRMRAHTIWEATYQHYHLMAVRFLVVAPSHRRLIADYAASEPFASPQPAWSSATAWSASGFGSITSAR